MVWFVSNKAHKAQLSNEDVRHIPLHTVKLQLKSTTFNQACKNTIRVMRIEWGERNVIFPEISELCCEVILRVYRGSTAGNALCKRLNTARWMIEGNKLNKVWFRHETCNFRWLHIKSKWSLTTIYYTENPSITKWFDTSKGSLRWA